MNARVVAVNAHPDATLNEEQEALTPLGVRIERIRVQRDAELLAGAADADVVAPMGYRLGAAAIAGLTRCRHIPSGGIGVDHIDVHAATAHGILVTNMGDTFVEEVANQTWMLLLLVARRGLWLHEMATTNRWREALDQLFPIQRLAMPRVTGQTLGLVSFGRIARAVARRGKAFGMDVVAYDPYVPDETFREHAVERATIEDVFRRGDFVSCHLPWSAETFHLVGEAHFRLMKPSAIFLNTGRGKVVDEAALIRALQSQRIAGAGLDVLEQEPPDPANPLLKMRNVAISPHMASVSDVSTVERRRLLGRQISEALQGKVPKGVVNPAVLEKWRGNSV
jgi:D-3-phosphoglycerate dehydrogenase